jgi:hypothetical protein
MAIGEEEVSIELAEAGPQVPPQDVSGIPLIAGCAADGPFNTPRLIATIADLAEFRTGAGPSLSAQIVSAGRQHVFVRVREGTPGFYGPVKKTYGNPRGAITALPGVALLPGLSANGQLYAEALQMGVSLQCFVEKPNAKLEIVPVPPGSKQVVIKLASDGAGKEQSLANEVLAALAAEPSAAALLKLSLTPGSDGKGVVQSQMGAVLALDDGAVAFQPQKQPLQLEVVTPAAKNAKLQVTLSGTKLRIENATDGNGISATTPKDLLAEWKKLPGLFEEVTLLAVGSGALRSALQASVMLVFGSSGTCMPMGLPADRADCAIRVVQPGMVGATPPPTIQFSLDDADSPDPRNRGGSWSAEIAVPGDGVVSLADENFPSGISAKLGGQQDTGDIYRWAAFGPEPSASTLLEGLKAAYSDPQQDFGFSGPAGYVDATLAMSIDGLIAESQKRPLYRWTYAIVNSRDQGPAESNPDYEKALADDFFGIAPVQSRNGKVSLINGWGRCKSPLTQRWHRRPASWYIIMTRSLRPVHEQPGNHDEQVGPGPASNFGFLLFYHDANIRPALRMRGRATSIAYEKQLGWFATEWLTLAPTSSKYIYGPWMAVIMGSAQLLQNRAAILKLSTVDADENNRIAGSDKNAIEQQLASALSGFLFTKKQDGHPSAKRNPPEFPLIQLGNNDIVNTAQLEVLAQIFAQPFIRGVKIRLVLSTQPATTSVG